MSVRALSLSDDLTRLLAEGAASIEISRLPDRTAASNAGALLWLMDGRGEVLGTGLADPDNDAVHVLSRESVGSLSADFLRARVREALEFRRALGLVDGESAFRLLNGGGDALGGFAADVYGEWAVLYVHSRGLLGLGRSIAEAIVDVCNVRGVVVKLRTRGGARPGKIKQQVVGEEPAAELTALELGVPYEVHLLGGLNVGLFCDMREHRRNFARWTAGRRVLNTFAYTGAFSVTAARAGAQSVRSVDLSSGVLKWTQANFRLSGLDPDDGRWSFEGSDVFRYLEAAAKRDERWDTIILDPPTYSAARTASWSMKNDYPDLIAAAARLLPDDGGILWVASNAWRGGRLEKPVQEGLARCGRRGDVLETGGLPPDFPTPASAPLARYLQVVVLRVR